MPCCLGTGEEMRVNSLRLRQVDGTCAVTGEGRGTRNGAEAALGISACAVQHQAARSDCPNVPGGAARNGDDRLSRPARLRPPAGPVVMEDQAVRTDNDGVTTRGDPDAGKVSPPCHYEPMLPLRPVIAVDPPVVWADETPVRSVVVQNGPTRACGEYVARRPSPDAMQVVERATVLQLPAGAVEVTDGAAGSDREHVRGGASPSAPVRSRRQLLSRPGKRIS